MPSGYSATPLAKKLSLKDGMRVWRYGMPDSVAHEIAVEGLRLQFLRKPEAPVDAAHVFVTSRSELDAKLRELAPLLARTGMIWVSWPKKAARVATDVTEDVVRDIALPMHLVDVKVCSVDDIWSGLKLLIRKEHR
jgi:hypothetical protein